MSEVKEQPSSRQRHRREVRNEIMLPMLAVVGALALILIVFAVVLIPKPPSAAGRMTSIVASCMSVCFILLPVLLCGFIPLLLSVMAAIGIWKGNNLLTPALGHRRGQIINLLRKVQLQAPRLAKPVIELESRLARVERIIGAPTTPPVISSDVEKE